MSERIDGFPLDFGQVLNVWKNWPKSIICESKLEDAFENSRYNMISVIGRGWKLHFYLWLDPMPNNRPRMTFEGDLTAFEEDYLEAILRSE